MSHDSPDDDAVIILSKLELPAGCTKPIDNLVAAGAYGSSREEVVRHFVCSRLGVDPSAAPKPVAKKKAAKKKAPKKS